MLSTTERDFITDGIVADVRCDGRRRVQWRKPSIMCGTARYAAGSAVVDMEGTRVRAAVSVDFTDEADAPALRFAVDVSASAAPPTRFGRQQLTGSLGTCLAALYGVEGGDEFWLQPNPASDVLARPGGFASRGAQCVLRGDQLAISDGFRYTLLVDVSLVSAAGGNVETAAALAVKAALANTRLPAATVSTGPDGVAAVAVDDTKPSAPLDATGCPTLVCCRVHQGLYVADPSAAEELAFPSWFRTGAAEDGAVCHSAMGGAGAMVSAQDYASLLHDAGSICAAYHDVVAAALESS